MGTLVHPAARLDTKKAGTDLQTGASASPLSGASLSPGHASCFCLLRTPGCSRGGCSGGVSGWGT